MRLIGADGETVGEFLRDDALAFADTQGLDLVLVAPDASPPVAKLTDLGRLTYQRDKKRRETKRNAVRTKLKHLKIRPKTGEHDLAVMIRRARTFLLRRDKVKLAVWFRGREHAHRDIGVARCNAVAKALADIATVEVAPHMDGRRMYMVLAPLPRQTVSA